MHPSRWINALFATVMVLLLIPVNAAAKKPQPADNLLMPGEEKHMKNLRQLTFGGENAEGYFSPDSKWLIYQSHEKKGECDQIYIMNLATGETKMVSTGGGVTTCSFFIPGTDEFIYASTHGASMECPPAPDQSLGYVWPLHKGFDIYRARRDGTVLQQLTDTPGYDAESVVSPDGKSLVFCSIRSGDLDLYKMNIDGTNLKRLTWTLGYDGGPFFSPKGTYIVYRSNHPVGREEIDHSRYLTSHEVVSPMRLEIMLMKADGSEQYQVTNMGTASFGPYMHPDEERIIFSSNYGDSDASNMSRMPNFELYLIHKDGTGLEKITNNPSFDGFPMFSNDGKLLVFASNRGGKGPGETNLFLADWID
ncbi:MAG: hypothetical protein V2A56_06170 [bacterium]